METTPCVAENDLPKGFVHVDMLAPGIAQSLRYATKRNFVGRPITGYEGARAILSVPAAEALARAQEDDNLRMEGLRLKILDAYRPQRAVDDFVRWAADSEDMVARGAYHPDIPKTELFARGYIARRSGHSRGSTVDLTLERFCARFAVVGEAATKARKRSLHEDSECATMRDSKEQGRAEECGVDDVGHWEEVDMGSPFDFFGAISHSNSLDITGPQRAMRNLLCDVMERQNFCGYDKEWWHFTLQPEPFPDTYFDFVVR